MDTTGQVGQGARTIGIAAASIAVTTILFAAACGSSPGAPSGVSAAAASSTTASSATNGLRLIAVAGSGAGTFNDTPTADDNGFTLHGELNINVHGAPPNTVLYLQRAGDVGLPGGQQADGTCQRANAGFFMPVPLDASGAPAILETSPGGAGSLHVRMEGNDPRIPDGGSTDVVYRLVNARPPATPTVDLRTPCFTYVDK
jgi:hypothetical protein